MSQLETWEMVYDDLLEEIEEKDISASNYKPPLSRSNYCMVYSVEFGVDVSFLPYN